MKNENDFSQIFVDQISGELLPCANKAAGDALIMVHIVACAKANTVVLFHSFPLSGKLSKAGATGQQFLHHALLHLAGFG